MSQTIETSSDFDILKRYYGSHSAVARELGFTPRWYRQLRSMEKRPVHVTKLILCKVDQVKRITKWK